MFPSINNIIHGQIYKKLDIYRKRYYHKNIFEIQSNAFLYLLSLFQRYYLLHFKLKKNRRRVKRQLIKLSKMSNSK